MSSEGNAPDKKEDAEPAPPPAPGPRPDDVNNFDDAGSLLTGDAPGPDGPPPDYPGAGTPSPDLVKKLITP